MKGAFAKSLNDVTQSCKASRELLDPLEVPEWTHHSDGLDLIRDGFNATFGHNEA